MPRAVSLQEPLPDDVVESISRCAEALKDLPRLTDELHVLRLSSDPRAQLATSLFDLERARRGDPEARARLGEVADGLLVFWKQGNGAEVASVHPVMEELWASAASLMVSFEVRRFTHALERCWEARGDRALLAEAIAGLEPEGNRRVEFSRCLYHLELARMGVDSSRGEFARRAGLLAEAYQQPEVATELVGDDAGLSHLWSELVPYLDEFFEHLEEQAERAARAEPVRQEARTDVHAAYVPRPPALGSERQIPSFRSLIGDRAELLEEVDVVEAPPTPPPPLPSHEVELGAEDLIDVTEDGPPRPPPLPTTQRRQAPDTGPLPPVEHDGPTPATREFWRHAFDQLGLSGSDEARSPRLLACETRADRKRLNAFISSIEPFKGVPEARAFACLMGLMLAGQTKERNLFGQPNPRRGEAMAAALPWLATSAQAVGHVAVWFELDGPQTQAALEQGLELLRDYLAFCLKHSLDPLGPRAVAAFTGVT